MYQRKTTAITRVVGKRELAMMNEMMRATIEWGTGKHARLKKWPAAGKTGTTNDYLDAWFMGFSPDLVAGVYVGYDTPKPLANEAGGKAAAPIFRDFMREALKDKAIVPFRIPDGITLSPVTRDINSPVCRSA